MSEQDILKHYKINNMRLDELESATFNLKTRTDLLNYLTGKFDLQHYLEIGCQTNVNFKAINSLNKISVDPDPEASAKFCVTSDAFFNDLAGPLGYSTNKFDLVFIDGLHTAEQVERDFINAVKYLKLGGFIVLHDCNPEKEEYARVPRETKVWNGDVFQFATRLFNNNFHTVDIDHGCGVYRHEKEPLIVKKTTLRWEEFDRERKDALNLISWDEFVEKF